MNLFNIINAFYPFVVGADISNTGALSIDSGQIYLHGAKTAQIYTHGMKAGQVAT